LTKSSILVVEQSGDVGEVLREAFRRRGLQVYEASCTDSGLDLARRVQPDLIVLDLDQASYDSECFGEEFCRRSELKATPIIMLGAMRRPTNGHGECVAKPYYYSALVSRIEQMLQVRADGKQNAA
jgi:two-component system, OmpR family, alkaline phosphatase synthesis response regulator PhoP